jgi:hypothetical protein
MGRDNIVQAIFAAIRRANQLRGPNEQLTCEATTRLYGLRGSLDSLGLVSLILDVEEAIKVETGRYLVLADDRALSLNSNPFRDVNSLTDYVLSRLEDADPCPICR